MVNRVGNPRYPLSEPKVFFKFAPVKAASHVGILPSPSHCRAAGSRMRVDFRRTGDAGGECGDVPHGRVGIGESDGFESFLRGFRGEFHLFVVESRVDGRHGPVIDVHVQVTHLTTCLIVFVDEFFRDACGNARASRRSSRFLVQLVDG